MFAPALAVTPVDTTGAGDCFNAGFLHAWLTGYAPGDCLRAANICGALSTESYGGIEGFPSQERFQREMHKIE
jgi:sugar/nucleoside kinase (ribokinase family)